MPDALLFRRAVLAQLEAASPASLPVETVSEGLRLAGSSFPNANFRRLSNISSKRTTRRFRVRSFRLRTYA